MSANTNIRLALLISGGGTTMEAILKECRPTGRLYGITPACVISSVPDAGGIAKAQRFLSEDDVLFAGRKNFATSEEFGKTIITACRERGVDWIGQYGWMPMTPRNVIEAFDGRMINQHPGPVRPGQPGFGGKGMYGRRVHCARLNFVRRTRRDYWTESTAQRVHPEFDEGEVIKIGRVTIRQNDSTESLQQRVLPVEHETQIQALMDVMHRCVAPVQGLEPLIRPGEEELLEHVKRAAIESWPQG